MTPRGPRGLNENERAWIVGLPDSALSIVTERSRRMLFLRYNQRWTFDQIGAEYGIVDEAVRRAIGRAVARLRKETR